MNDSSRLYSEEEHIVSNCSKREFKSNIIPNSFMLGGLKIDVEIDETLKEKNMIGQANYVAQMIKIDPTISTLQFVEQSFVHELVHWIFYMIDEDELRQNEKLVDLFAHFLYQALTSAEFGEIEHRNPKQ